MCLDEYMHQIEANKQSGSRANRLQGQQDDAQRPLVQGPSYSEHYVDQSEVDEVLLVGWNAIDGLVQLVLIRTAGTDRGTELSNLSVEAWEPVARTRDDLEELRARQKKVDDLRNEEEHQRLAEVPVDPHHGEGHASKVAEGVAHEDPVKIRRDQRM